MVIAWQVWPVMSRGSYPRMDNGMIQIMVRVRQWLDLRAGIADFHLLPVQCVAHILMLYPSATLIGQR